MKEEKEEKINWKELVENLKKEFEEELSLFKEELKKIRSSRPSPALVEDLEVDLYGKKFRLKNIAQISILPPRQIKIDPWDPSYSESILKALSKRDFGSQPSVSGNSILIQLPPLSEEFRKELIRLVGELENKTKQRIRDKREDCWRKIQKGFLEKKISEDDKYRAKDQIQDLIEEYNKKIEDLVEEKKKDILS